MKNMKMKFKIAVLAFAALAAAYFVFDWTMSAVIHSKRAVMVPDLRGKTLEESGKLLKDLGLSVKSDGEVFDKEVPAGTVVRQSPPAGLSVREGKTVKVTMSQGGESVFVPDVTGQPVRSAEISIRTAGFALGEESTRYSLKVQRDHVISQDPAAGAAAERDALVNLVISGGEPPSDVVLMPDLTGMDIAEAKSWAESKGVALAVREERSMEYGPGSVIKQSADPDSELGSKGVSVVVASAGSKAAASGKKFYYEVPQGDSDRKLRIVLLDESGEQELFNGSKMPGAKLELPVNPRGRAKVRIFVNGILVEEREAR